MASASFVETLQATLIAELERLHDEVRKTADALSDQQLWQKPVQPGNSVGHLILHLTGNLNHFVGAQIGKTGYVRDREREFTETSPPSRQQLMQQLDAAVATFESVVGSLTEDLLTSAHPEQRFGTVLKALVQILSHFALHRGQMSYIARLVSQS
jgi:uncharacterized damage-inducible protein DinB